MGRAGRERRGQLAQGLACLAEFPAALTHHVQGLERVVEPRR